MSEIIVDCPGCDATMLLGEMWAELITEDGLDAPECPDCDPDGWTDWADPKLSPLMLWAYDDTERV